MTFDVYDYRTDVRNILVTPEIRSRFLRVEPGGPAGSHTHDLGHEVFLVLDGIAEFEIDGSKRQVGPGQMCVALAGQLHGVRAVGDRPTTMYLSVTPHVQPTHTFWDDAGRRLPHRFAPSSNYDVEIDTETPVSEMLARLEAATASVMEAAQAAAGGQRDVADAISDAVEAGDIEAAGELRNAVYDLLRPLLENVAALEKIWNDAAPRTGPTS